jgi:hypothetical protein
MTTTINASTSAGLVQTADTSGVLALQSNGTTALSTSGANVTIAGTLTTAAQSIAKASLPTGSVLQVVQATTTTPTSTTSTSFVTTSLAASITPTSSSSKILVFANGTVNGNSTGVQPVFTIYRGATNLGESTRGFGQIYNAGAALNAMGPMQYLDSPATTSSTTYTVYMKVNTGTGVWGHDSGTQVMTLMEIAA